MRADEQTLMPLCAVAALCYCLCIGAQAALAAYQDAAAATTAATRAALRHLSESLQAQLPAIVQCAHWSVIAQVATLCSH
jgi:hypothetical protein